MFISFTIIADTIPLVHLEKIPFDGRRAKVINDSVGNAHMVFNRMGNMFYSKRLADESSFSEPIRVNSIERSPAIGEIAIGSDGTIHVLYHGNIFFVREKIKGLERKVNARDIKYTFYSRLKPGADQFEPQQEMSQGAWGFDGGCTITADGNGNVYAFFAGMKEQGKESDRKVFLRVSSDAGESFGDAQAIDLGLGVCMCCHLKSHTDDKGNLYLAYRVAPNGVDRDSFVLMSANQGQSFSSTPLDKWKLRACPGSAYSFASDGHQTFVSYRNQDDVFCQPTNTTKPIALPDSNLKRRAAVMTSNHKGLTLMTWTEGENFNKPHALAWQIYDSAGAPIGAGGRLDAAFQRWGLPAAFIDGEGEFVILH
ncbi:MAG: hypothetical protein HOH33_01530 [Verrucomicrobia bacterium]|nr:hypothetical protein [Verrucomicrobiota bacterium]